MAGYICEKLMKKNRWQLGLAATFIVAVIGASEAAWAGDYDLLQQEADNRGQPFEDYLRSLRSGDLEVEPDPPPRRRAEGSLRQVQLAAEVMLHGEAGRAWGWPGRLTTEDLTNDFATFDSDGVRAFNVLDAEGFFERFKCNLFVFELAYRAGLRVPLMGRPFGWGYIGPAEVLRQIEREQFDRNWAYAVDEMEIDELREGTQRGIPFILVGEGSDGRAGHMGMVDEIHVLERNDEGAIHRVVYSGWEANGDGAHYQRRTWGLWRFDSIHVLELRDPEAGQAQCFPIDRGPTFPSDLDVARAIVQVGAGTDVIVRRAGIDLDGFEGGPSIEDAAIAIALLSPTAEEPTFGTGHIKTRPPTSSNQHRAPWARESIVAITGISKRTGLATLLSSDMGQLYHLLGAGQGFMEVFRRRPAVPSTPRPSPTLDVHKSIRRLEHFEEAGLKKVSACLDTLFVLTAPQPKGHLSRGEKFDDKGPGLRLGWKLRPPRRASARWLAAGRAT